MSDELSPELSTESPAQASTPPRRRRHRIRKWLIAAVCGFVVLALVAGVALTVILRAPLPQYDGTITLAGPTDEVAVSRDGQGVPHIYASSDHDLFFAQGYVQAQDRFFQMDLRRHLTAGRLSELVGEAGKVDFVRVVAVQVLQHFGESGFVVFGVAHGVLLGADYTGAGGTNLAVF